MQHRWMWLEKQRLIEMGCYGILQVSSTGSLGAGPLQRAAQELSKSWKHSQRASSSLATGLSSSDADALVDQVRMHATATVCHLFVACTTARILFAEAMLIMTCGRMCKSQACCELLLLGRSSLAAGAPQRCPAYCPRALHASGRR